MDSLWCPVARLPLYAIANRCREIARPLDDCAGNAAALIDEIGEQDRAPGFFRSAVSAECGCRRRPQTHSRYWALHLRRARAAVGQPFVKDGADMRRAVVARQVELDSDPPSAYRDAAGSGSRGCRVSAPEPDTSRPRRSLRRTAAAVRARAAGRKPASPRSCKAHDRRHPTPRAFRAASREHIRETGRSSPGCGFRPPGRGPCCALTSGGSRPPAAWR